MLSLTSMLREKEFYTHAVKLEGQNSFAVTIKSAITREAMERLNKSKAEQLLPKKWLTPERVADYFAESLSYAIIEWVKDDMQVPLNELVDIIIYVANHSLGDIIANLYR